MKKISLWIAIFLLIGELQSQVLEVKEMTQEQDQWCWAGVSACILDYYCVPTPQCEIAEYTRTVENFPDMNLGNTDCCVSPVSCNHWNYAWGGTGSIQDILMHFANISNEGYYALSQEEVLSDIQNNRLFVIRWGWLVGGGHFLVGHGLVGNNLYYMDPWFGEGYKISNYDWVVSNNEHEWTHTNRIIVTIDVIKPEPAGAISGQTIVCQGEKSITYSVPEIEYAENYLWTLPNGTTETTSENEITIDYEENAQSGDIAVRGVNDCGEGEASFLSVIVNLMPDTPVILLNNNVLSSDSPEGNQWYNQNGIIEGATAQTYTVTVDGDYYDVVTLAGCSSQSSNTISVIINGIELNETDEIKIYPNPVSDELIIESGRNETTEFEIFNLSGRLIFKGEFMNKASVQTNSWSSGAYFIKITNEETSGYRKFIKE